MRARCCICMAGAGVLGTIQSHFSIMARLAELTGFTVIGIDYGLAPEAPFPAGLNDAVAALRTLRAGAPVQPWLVAGDSAGANIAMAMMLDLRDAGERLRCRAAVLACFQKITRPTHTGCAAG